jgi:hypothetical protein
MIDENGTTVLEPPVTSASLTAEARNQHPDSVAPNNFVGAYTFHLTGTLFLPAPYDSSNGPFFRLARFHSDGSGHIEISTVIANYAGRVERERYSVVYKVDPDGCFIMEATDVPMPGVPAGVPHVITLEGVIAEGGNRAICGVTRFSMHGRDMANIGSVISGQIIRQ